MAQIPGLPTTEPVEKPQASPRQFGSAGEAVYEAGEETAQLAQANLAFSGHLIEAQRYLKAKQAEIAYDRVLNQVHADLAKTVTPEDADAVYAHAKGELAHTLSPFETDRVLGRQLAIFGAQQDVELQSRVNGRKATLIQRGDEAATKVKYDKLRQEGVNTIMAGGTSQTAEDKFKAETDSSVHVMGTMIPAQQEALQRSLKHDIQTDVVAAYSNGTPAQRQQVINQLRTGEGKLDLSTLDKGEINQLLTTAIDTDHSLTQKEEAGSLNGAINITSQWFSSPEFKHPDGTPNDENIESALTDGEQLTKHGIITPDGKPNFVMADKLIEHYSRLWQMHQKVQKDKDEEVLEKYAPRIYDPKHPMSIAEIEALPQTEHASERAVNQLKTALFQEQRNARVLRNEERSLNLQERRQRREELEDRSIATSLTLADRMAKGDVIDYNNDILTPISKGQMTEADGAKVWRMYKDSDQYPQIGEGIGIIGNVFKAMPQTPENNRKAADARDAFLKAVKDKNLHGADILREAEGIAEGTGKQATDNAVQQIWHNLWHGPLAPVTPTKAPPAKDTQDFVEGGKTYHIPASMVEEFRKDHPNASTATN